jgi:hypothetical protein
MRSALQQHPLPSSAVLGQCQQDFPCPRGCSGQTKRLHPYCTITVLAEIPSLVHASRAGNIPPSQQLWNQEQSLIEQEGQQVAEDVGGERRRILTRNFVIVWATLSSTAPWMRELMRERYWKRAIAPATTTHEASPSALKRVPLQALAVQAPVPCRATSPSLPIPHQAFPPLHIVLVVQAIGSGWKQSPHMSECECTGARRHTGGCSRPGGDSVLVVIQYCWLAQSQRSALRSGGLEERPSNCAKTGGYCCRQAGRQAATGAASAR